MRILSPIVLAHPLLIARRQSDLGLCRAIRANLVGHQHSGCEALFLEQLAHQFHRCGFIAPSLHEQIEYLAFVVNRAPQPKLPARDHHGHLVEMPTRRWPRASTAKFSGEPRSELQNPSSHRFVGDIDPTLRKQIFDVAIAERETHIEPNGVRMIAGGNWWRANEIVIRHLTRQTVTRYRCRNRADRGLRGLVPERKKVGMLFAHLKRVLRLDRLRQRGPNGAKDEFLLAATAQDLRNLAKLIPLPAPVFTT